MNQISHVPPSLAILVILPVAYGVVGCYDDFTQILNEWQMKVSYEMRNSETVETRFSKMTETNGK